MIGRGRAQLHRQAGSAQVLKFIRVDLERKAERLRAGQDAAALDEAERAILAEYVHKGQRAHAAMLAPPGLERRQHLSADQRGVGIRVVFKFGRDGMRSQEGRRDLQRPLIIQAQQRFELDQLEGRLETVPGLGFSRRRAMGEHGARPRAGLIHELFQAGPA